ncbi:MAG TPA: carbon storage regulator [Patescibacteria group bacterium]
MLVLKRRVGEVIFIGEDIRIVVLGIEGAKVKIGIDAPNDVAIIREELVKEEVSNVQTTD